MVSDPTRTRMVVTSKNLVRDFFAAPRPQDGTLDFSIESAWLAVVATNEDSAKNVSEDASFKTAVKGSDDFTINSPFSTGDVEIPTTLAVSVLWTV